MKPKMEKHHKQKAGADERSLVDRPAEKSPNRWRRYGYISLIGSVVTLLIAVLYSQVIQSPLLFDDIPNIRDNKLVRITDLLPGTLVDAGIKSVASNRPVANISFAINYYFHGYHVMGYHIVNMVIHLLTGLFLFLLLQETLRITKNKSLSFLVSESDNVPMLAFTAALIWLVHPLATQSVSYIVQRMTSMSAMFYALSLLCYVRGRVAREKNSKWMLFGACIISGVLAVGSKEIAVTLPFFILLYEWFFFRDLDTTWLRRNLPYISIVIAIGIILTLFYLRGVHQSSFTEWYSDRDFNLGQRVLTEFRIVLMYLGLIFVPNPGRLNLDYDFPLSYTLINPPTTLLAILVVAGLIIFAIFLAKRERLISFAILWFFGNLAIESSVIPLELVYEHRTYLPSMFVVFLAVIMVNHYLKPRWAQVLVFCCVTAVFSFWTFQRNIVWHDEISLFQDCLMKSPHKSRTHNNYGLALMGKGRVDEAIAQCSQAVELAPNIPGHHISLGTAYMKKGELDKAIAQYQMAINLDTKDMQFPLNMAKALEKKGKPREAMKYYAEVLRKEPKNVLALNGMGGALATLGRYDEAMRYLAVSQKDEPDNPETYNHIGNILLMQGKIEAAKKHYLAAIEKNNEYKEAYYNLGMAMIQQGRTNEGISYIEKAIEVSPLYEQAHSSLAATYFNTFALDKAVRQFQEILRINPANADAQKKLKTCLDLRTRLDAAIAGVHKQIDASGDSAELHYKLGDLLQRRGDIDGAVAELQKALAIKQLQPALHSLAVIYSLKGDNEKALQYLEEMRRINPNDPEVYYNLACIYSKQGKFDDSLRSLQGAINKGFNKQDVLKTDPDLANVRETDGYKKLIQSK
jgi:protein O-mannosyl-transferase